MRYQAPSFPRCQTPRLVQHNAVKLKPPADPRPSGSPDDVAPEDHHFALPPAAGRQSLTGNTDIRGHSDWPPSRGIRGSPGVTSTDDSGTKGLVEEGSNEACDDNCGHRADMHGSLRGTRIAKSALNLVRLPRDTHDRSTAQNRNDHEDGPLCRHSRTRATAGVLTRWSARSG